MTLHLQCILFQCENIIWVSWRIKLATRLFVQVNNKWNIKTLCGSLHKAPVIWKASRSHVYSGLMSSYIKNQQDSSECLLMLIEIINKGSVPYYGSHVSNSTGVSLSDILFSFMLEKYIVCNVCGLRSPSIESSGVLYISPTHTSSMQELIMQGLQQKLEKSCFRCNKNTWHVESNHILQPPNYLIIVVNRFRYINNQFAKDKCSIPMDMTVVLGYHKFSLQATIDHHGPSIYSGHYTTSVNCCNRTFYCNDNKITEFDMINTKNSSTAYVVIYKLIT